MSMFDAVEAGPPIEIFELTKRYREDTFPQKVDLGVGGEFAVFKDTTILIMLLF